MLEVKKMENKKRDIKEEFNEVLEEMTDEEKKNTLLWLDGVRFMRNLDNKTKDETCATSA